MTHKPIAAGKSSFDLIDSQKLFAELDLKPGMVFLDVACGVGEYSLAISPLIGPNGKIYAVDLWKEGIATLKRHIRARGIKNIQASVSDVSQHIPVADHSVDLVLMATVLHDLVEDSTDQGMLSEVQRVMKPGGMLAVIEFRKIEGPPGPPIRIRISPPELEERLCPFSFHVVRTVDIGPYNYLSIFAATGSGTNS